jgi:hypothetical protein
MEPTKTDIYDMLVKLGVKEPAVVQFGGRCIIGAWEVIGEITESGWVFRGGKKAVRVYGDATTWKEAISLAGEYLRRTGLDGSKTSDTFPSPVSAVQPVFVSGTSF